MANSKTAQAVKLVRSGETVRSAARTLDISEAAVYAQIKRDQGKPICPCCGQIVREGFEINRAVLNPDHAS